MLSLGSSDAPLVYQNNLTKLVTSLPYIDVEADDYIKIKVERMIKAEMATMGKVDYLKDLPMPETSFFDSPTIQTEIARVKAHNLLEDPVTLTLPNINIDSADIAQLKAFNDTACTIMQHNVLRQTNLELMLKYGPDAHKIFLEFLGKRKERLDEDNNQIRS